MGKTHESNLSATKVAKMSDKRKILIVDDDEVVRLSYLRSLSGSSCNVEAASNGEEALQTMEQGPVDVVLLDIRMPGMDGMSVLRAIKQKWPASEVVIITGYPSVDNAKDQADGPAGRNQRHRRRDHPPELGAATNPRQRRGRLYRLSGKSEPIKLSTEITANSKKEKTMTATRKVLVVDDDPVVRKSFDRVLTGKGYAVITAENGEEALRKLADEKYDVVYTDIRMPGMNGLEVAEQLKAKQPWTPVVIITGYGTEEAEARAKAAGVSNFLHKPLSPETIEGSARTALAVPEPAVEPEVEPVIETQPAAAEEAGPRSPVLNILLFFAAPFIGLAYIIAFPFVGMGVIAVFAARAANKVAVLNKIGRALKFAGLFLAAPFLGLAYVTIFPIVGLVMLAWMGGRAMLGARPRHG